jgi:conjugal transfer ATP-binding protein TraC
MESILKWLNGYSSPKKQKKKSNFVEKLKEEAKGVGESISEFFDSDESESTNKAFRSLLGIPQFKHLLPYVDYLDSEGLFLIDSGTLDDDGSGAISPGFVFQITPQTGATKNMERVLQSIFLQAPKGTQ